MRKKTGKVFNKVIKTFVNYHGKTVLVLFGRDEKIRVQDAGLCYPSMSNKRRIYEVKFVDGLYIKQVTVTGLDNAKMIALSWFERGDLCEK